MARNQCTQRKPILRPGDHISFHLLTPGFEPWPHLWEFRTLPSQPVGKRKATPSTYLHILGLDSLVFTFDCRSCFRWIPTHRLPISSWCQFRYLRRPVIPWLLVSLYIDTCRSDFPCACNYNIEKAVFPTVRTYICPQKLTWLSYYIKHNSSL